MLLKLLNWIHRWIGLLVFGQVLLWSLGGLLMAGLNFGDLYREPPPAPLSVTGATLSPDALAQHLQHVAPGSQLLGIRVRNVAGELVYQLDHLKGPPLLFNRQGQVISPISPALAERVARLGYTGTGPVNQTELLPTSTGNYVSSQPIYRITFADAQKTEIYVDPNTGSLLARRKALWALYNRMWEFHLMKYTPSPAVNKALLLLFAVLNALVALTGFAKFFRWGYRLRPVAKAKGE